MKQKITPKAWRRESDELVADCRVFKVKKRKYVHPDGRAGSFYVNESPDWIQAAALVKDKKTGKLKTVLVNQFRFGTESNSWEFPGGVAEDGETPQQAAARELLEETGYAGGRAKLVASYSPNPAIQSNLAHFVVIENCKKVAPAHWDENEEIETKLADVDKLDALVGSKKIFHAIAINSIYFLQKYLERKARKA